MDTKPRIERLGPLPGGAPGEALGLARSGEAAQPVLLCDVPGELWGEPGRRAQLERDLQRAAGLLHANVAQPLGLEESGSGAARVEAWVEGERLSDVLATGGRMPPVVAARVLADACAGVQFAHEDAGGGSLVHGHLRPEALLVARSGATLVRGFGAAAVEGARPLRERLPWVSPEQLLGGPGAADRQSDVFLLGLVLHACLAGEDPFAGEPDLEKAVMDGRPAPLEAQGVPRPLAEVVERATARKASDRYPSAAALARAVERAAGELAPPSAVTAWLDVLLPADEGVRAERGKLLAGPAPAAQPGGPEPAGAAPAAAGAAPAAAEPAEAASAAVAKAVPGAPGPGGAEGAAEAPPRLPETVRDEHIVGSPTPVPIAPSAPVPVAQSAPAQAAPSPPVPVAPSAPVQAVPSLPATAPPPPPPVDLMRTADIVADSPPVEMLRSADIVLESGSRQAGPDLVTTREIVGEGSAPFMVARPPAPPPESPRQTLSTAILAAGIAVAGLAIGFGLARHGGEPAAPASAEPAAIAPGAPPLAAEPSAAGATPVPAPRAEPRREPPGPPSIEVTADPAGEIYVDGKRAGRAPITKAVSRGRHKIRLVDKASGVDVSKVVEVKGARTPVRIAVGKGTLTVAAPEGAIIFLDGRKVGTGRVDDLPVYEGSHHISVRLGQARNDHEFRIGPDETYRYDVERATP
ncbi:MAG TPA: PEGA domain-containing protein [Anaeromyxobacteraceae bacterium]|nr:PEGA domain-containing protein [Anaeromyxobacteraceae bacterium]